MFPVTKEFRNARVFLITYAEQLVLLNSYFASFAIYTPLKYPAIQKTFLESLKAPAFVLTAKRLANDV